MNYIFENEHETLFETNDFIEMQQYLQKFILERDSLEYSNMYDSMHYVIFHFYGYYLMIKKNVKSF